MPDKTPELSTVEAEGLIAKKTAPRVTAESIKAKIVKASYVLEDVMTICILEVENGFRVVGTSSPASPGNFDARVGERLAYDSALEQLWPLEGYLLREELFNRSPTVG